MVQANSEGVRLDSTVVGSRNIINMVFRKFHDLL
jgi:hypothetical protein